MNKSIPRGFGGAGIAASLPGKGRVSRKTAALKVSKVGAFGRLASDEVGDGAADGSTAEAAGEKTRREAKALHLWT